MLPNSVNQEVLSPAFDQMKVFVDDSFADIVPWFMDNRREDVKKIKEFAGAEDYDQISKMGHRWKGTCASYGFLDLSEAGKALEELAAQKSKTGILELIKRTSKYIDQVEIVYVPEEGNT